MSGQSENRLQSTLCSRLKLVLGAQVPKMFGAGISRAHCLTVNAGSCKLSDCIRKVGNMIDCQPWNNLETRN